MMGNDKQDNGHGQKDPLAEGHGEQGWFQSGMTIREAMVRAAAWLSEQGIDEARGHAELLLMHVLELDKAGLLFRWNDAFPAEREKQWIALILRRSTGEPLQYMTGEGWFCGAPFLVSPSVLIPRPETELLAEGVLQAADRLWGSAAGSVRADANAAGPTVVDVGTGSGAIAVTLAKLRPGWRVIASDLSPDALEVARANADRHGTADRMAFAQGDLLAPFIAAGRGGTHVGGGVAIDVLVSNPPYIPAADLPGLQREVRDFEPHLALDGGADGLTPYRRMLEQLPLLPAMPRIVAFELGMGQPDLVAEMMRKMNVWDEITVVTDLNGIRRHVIAVRTKGAVQKVKHSNGHGSPLDA